MEDFTFTVSSDPVNNAEKKALIEQTESLNLNDTLWKLYESLLKSATKESVPFILRMHKDKDLVAVVILIKCYDYGSTMTAFKPVVKLFKTLRIPIVVWLRSGICAELLANPAFINTNYDPNVVLPVLMNYIHKNFFISFVLDLSSNNHIHGNSSKLPYPDEGVIDMGDVLSFENYRKLHKNVRKKINHFRNRGGFVEIIKGKLSDEDIRMVGKCVLLTSQHSVFKLPYQENYPAMCMATASMEENNVVHFVCRTENDFLGYHSFIDFGTHMRCLNGAFNRELKTTHHAYENMIARVVEYADENKIKRIYFGPVLNVTKSRMMHEFLPTTLHFMSNNAFVRKIFPLILKRSRMMQKNVLQFSSSVKQ